MVIGNDVPFSHVFGVSLTTFDVKVNYSELKKKKKCPQLTGEQS